MIVAVDIPEMKDIVDDATFRELTIVSKEMEREPYWFAHEGLNARLLKALRRCQEGGIERLPNGDHVVKGSAGHLYVVKGSTCECPASQKGKSSWCWHRVCVALYTEWQRRLNRGIRTPAPGQGVDTRLANTMAALDTMNDAAAAVRLDTIHASTRPAFNDEDLEARDMETPHTPQEDRMDDDDTQYIPEPDHVTTAVLDASDADFPPMGQAPTPALRPRTPQVDDLEAALQVWTTERAVVQRFLKQELKANVDYYTLRIGGKDSKPSLSKAGAEKVLGWLKIQASFTPDTGTWEMLGRPQDLLCYVCTLRTRSGEIVGEGRGARSLKKDNGDVNKAIKMAEKSSMVSAVLRTGALSDVFTSDLEDMQEDGSVKAAEPVKTAATPSADLRKRIWAQVNTQAPHVRTQDDARAWVQERTGLVMEADYYRAILAKLEGVTA